MIHSLGFVLSVTSETQTISSRVLASWRALATFHPTTPPAPHCFAVQAALLYSLRERGAFKQRCRRRRRRR